tara:strand:- start:209 stop:424 length:216 start_codon:yes stop_codon:yes gene_type:complete
MIISKKNRRDFGSSCCTEDIEVKQDSRKMYCAKCGKECELLTNFQIALRDFNIAWEEFKIAFFDSLLNQKS